MTELGSLIRGRRLELGLSQRALARRAGTTQAAISRIEAGATSPRWETARGLLLAMGCEPDLRARPLEARADPVQLAGVRRLPPSRRLAQAIAANRLASSLRAGARAERA